ncbi:Dioxygenase [Bibersteinia trehalosi USDA-ARS-USMARC-188]|uniref:Dioxygenase n=3 Tax=Bibersteinia trehalosi TaxID=47735 RepID=A0A4V7ICX0_BIBTR|nr:Dioxygenase [Bibersteinia trehalosi USDA-ARS-USMARC-192]AHG82821.1 Dioxygenase [Bibersteinia trehalosi USDA-ARS-USMARC-188]AHG85195.1 Dioxygenase [Bibersteinia trehalosi USDA-ARS-USMARC-189]
MMNRITQILNIKHPIVQAPMSWLTDAKLVAAVAEAGGLGFLAPHAGQNTNPSSNQEVLDRMRAEIRKVKTLTDKPFGVPFIVSYDFSLIEPMVELFIEEQVPVVLDNGLLDEAIYQKFKQAGTKIICRLPNPNLADALKAQELGADILVLTGFDEGGTLPAKENGSFSVLAEYVGKVDLPLMLAGGIADKRTVQAAFNLGAEGVWIGTAFIATEECRASENVKNWIVRANANDLLLFRTEPHYYRSLPTELAKKCFEMSENGATRAEIAKVMNAGTGMRLGMLEGDFENGYVSVGNGISAINKVQSVKGLIDELMGE